MSESKFELEKDLTLNADTEAVAASETVENKPAEENAEVAVDNQVENQEVVDEPVAEPAAQEVAPEPAQEEEKPQEPAKEEEKPQEPAQEEKSQEPVQEEEKPQDAPELPKIDFSALTKSQLVEELKKLLGYSVESVKDRVALIKAAFFAIHKEEIAKAKAQFVEQGNAEEAFVAPEDEDELKLKELLGEFKEKRAEFNAEQEAIKQANLEKKLSIIEEIKTISQDTDNINRQFSRVQQLQQEFKAIGEVPSTSTTEVWKAYQQAIENFYDLLKINKELRDYDFKKNLEIKQRLCEEAEALDEENDVIAAFKKLQALHDKWRETGPVAKDIREQLWARFKAASAVVNKKHQAYFEERKASEKVNADAKTALCEAIEKITTDDLKTYATWDEVTKQIIGLQEEWKKLGFASRKVNTALFTRFRKSCDDFFAKKAVFFKQMKEELAANLAKKNELCEKAEALKDSTEWKATTDALIALQKEWRTIGPVVKKHSDAVWKRFIAACDHFFEQKKKQHVNVHAVEHDNLKAKKEVIATLKATIEEAAEDAAQTVRDLMDRWQEIGHVPFKEKDKIYTQYRELIDKAFDTLNMRGSRPRNEGGSPRGGRQSAGSDRGLSERDRLVRTYEQRMSELKTFENNMGFLTANTKSGNSLVQEMERRIARLKEEIAELEQKIKEIDND